MKYIRAILLLAVFAINVKAVDRHDAEFKDLSELSQILPHDTTSVFSAYAKLNYVEYGIELPYEFVEKYLYQVQNLVTYCYDVNEVENSYYAYNIVCIGKRNYLIYSSSGPFNYSIYLADITDCEDGMCYPATLEIERWWAGETFMWSTCPGGIDSLTSHILQRCYSCESDEGQYILVEDTHTFKLSSGIESIGKGTEAYVYTIPAIKLPSGLTDIQQISLSNWTIRRDTAQWHVDIKDIPDLCRMLPRDTALIYSAVRQIIDGSYDTGGSVELSEDFVVKYLFSDAESGSTPLLFYSVAEYRDGLQGSQDDRCG